MTAKPVMMNVEMAFLHDDHTWWPEIVQVPQNIFESDDDTIVAWVCDNCDTTKTVVVIYVYSKHVEGDDPRLDNDEEGEDAEEDEDCGREVSGADQDTGGEGSEPEAR